MHQSKTYSLFALVFFALLFIADVYANYALAKMPSVYVDQTSASGYLLWGIILNRITMVILLAYMAVMCVSDCVGSCWRWIQVVLIVLLPLIAAGLFYMTYNSFNDDMISEGRLELTRNSSYWAAVITFISWVLMIVLLLVSFFCGPKECEESC